MSFTIASKGMTLSREIEMYPEGIVIAIDKPYKWTSADVVRKVKFRAQRHFRKKNLKVGHAGTLDPLATGILLVCIGNATKKAEDLQNSVKEYIADVTFGATTPSYDLEKEIDNRYPYSHIGRKDVEESLKTFLGEQQQVAPLFSAKSIDGVRAYEIARKMLRSSDPGAVAAAEEAGIRSSSITIYDIELLDFGTMETPLSEDTGEHHTIVSNAADSSLPTARIRIVCSKGTYIRALARDLGEALGSGAHLTGLKRTGSGIFTMAKTLEIEDAINLFEEKI